MATHSSILAWRIPWTEEPGRPWSMGSQRVGHDWSDWACTQKEIWYSRRVWQPTPVFSPGESPGQRSLAAHRVAKSQTQQNRPCMLRLRTLSNLWQLCPSGDPVWMLGHCLDPQIALTWGAGIALLQRAAPVLLTLLFPPYFLHPTEFCMFLHILFRWSGTGSCSQLQTLLCLEV